MLNENVLKKAIDILVEKLSPQVIYLFGSAARGELREDSDIDIAFLTDLQISHYECFILASEIADIFNKDIDLINLKDASSVFKAQIVGNGKKIYCSDENIRMYFEMRTLKEYALLNEERKVILDKIKEDGNIYRK
jgi:uncharacterized protein